MNDTQSGGPMDAKAKLMQRIQKLMALGSRNHNPHEVGRALQLAQKLMRRHSITSQELGFADISERECRQVYSDARRIPAWLNALAVLVCMATGCRCWFGWYTVVARDNKHRQRRVVHFYGVRARPQVAEYVFTVLARQLRQATRQHMQTAYRLPRLKLQTKRNRADQFRQGWVAGVWEVLEAFNLPASESALLQQWLLQRCGGVELSEITTREAGRCRGDEQACRVGWFAGRRAELRRGVEGSAVPPLRLATGGEHD